MNVNLNLSGIDELKSAMEDAKTKMNEFNASVSELYMALLKVGIEVSQPSGHTDS